MAKLPRDQVKVLDDYANRILDIVTLQKRLTSEGAMEKLTLLSLLRTFRARRASDPRDKVYALLSIGGRPNGMKADYSLNETEVFRQATLECISEEDSLSILSTDLGRKFRADLPSWVPDWGAPGSLTYGLRAAAVHL
jgi:hypothetical protein